MKVIEHYKKKLISIDNCLKKGGALTQPPPPPFHLNSIKMINELIIGLSFKKVRSKLKYFLPVVITGEKLLN